MKKFMACAAAAALLVTLSSCGSDAPPTSGNPGTEGAGTPSTSAPASPAPSPTSTSNRMATFGQRVIFPDGVAIKVDFAGWVAATPYASGAVEGRIAAFTVTVTNGSKNNWQGALLGIPEVRVGPSLIPANVAADEGMDHFLTTVLPGESQTAVLGFGISEADSGQVRLEFISADFIGPSAIFQGALTSPSSVL